MATTAALQGHCGSPPPGMDAAIHSASTTETSSQNDLEALPLYFKVRTLFVPSFDDFPPPGGTNQHINKSSTAPLPLPAALQAPAQSWDAVEIIEYFVLFGRLGGLSASRLSMEWTQSPMPMLELGTTWNDLEQRSRCRYWQ